MKSGWIEKPLGECFRLKSGDGLTSKMMSDGGAYPVFGGNGIAGSHDNFNLSGSNVIIGRVGALCGNARHIKEKIWLTDNAFKIVDFNYEFDHSFLTYLLNYKNLRNFARQAAQPVISNSSLKDILLQFPTSLSEQQRIVSVLDEAFASIAQAKANAERNLVNARELFESVLESFFEDPQHTPDGKVLESLCELIVDCEHKTAPIQKEGYPSIRTPNIGRGYLILDRVNRVSELTYKRWTRRAIPQGGDLILAREAPAGNVAVIPEGLEPCLGQRTVLIRPNKKVFSPYYLMWLLLSDNVQKFFLHNSKGSTVVHVNMKDIRGLKINSLPLLAEQRAIISKLEALSAETKRLEEIYQSKLEALEELKKSVLAKAFAGEL